MGIDLAMRERYDAEDDTDLELNSLCGPQIGIGGCDKIEPHKHPFYQIIYVEKMRGKHVIDLTPYEDVEDMIFVVNPSQVHYWENVSEISGVEICFGEKFFCGQDFIVGALQELNIIRGFSGMGLKIEGESKAVVHRLINMIDTEIMWKKTNWRQVARACVSAMVKMLMRAEMGDDKSVTVKKSSDLYEEFQQLIIKHGGGVMSVRDCAEKMQISLGYLNEQVRRNAGMTPGKMIRKTIVDEACRLIANTDLAIGEVAKALGFRDGAYFSRIFKKQTGIAPLKFKQKIGGTRKAPKQAGMTDKLNDETPEWLDDAGETQEWLDEGIAE
ncbi:MAG: helix-turn-helix transcriptional regulator [Clostridiales Family XIII bacterium]|jgi:AraC-like DNA-binding protein|nr:helix-turn-helix transcriptional regulator [Clostridiales Family XIII bacterium]